MNKNIWTKGCLAVLLTTGLSAISLAQEVPGAVAARSSRPAPGFIAMLDQKVGLTPEQRDSVRGLFAEQRRKTQALRDDTDNKIRALLTPEQQKKFDDLLAAQKARRFHKS